MNDMEHGKRSWAMSTWRPKKCGICRYHDHWDTGMLVKWAKETETRTWREKRNQHGIHRHADIIAFSPSSWKWPITPELHHTGAVKVEEVITKGAFGKITLEVNFHIFQLSSGDKTCICVCR